MQFKTDKHAAEFGGVKIYVEEYSVDRTAAYGETVLTDGRTVLHFGGGGTVKIRISGKSEEACAAKLDELIGSGAAIDLSYAGMVFENVILVKYNCKAESGRSETVTAEFIGTSKVDASQEEA